MRTAKCRASLMTFLARSKRVSRTWSPAAQPTSTPSAAIVFCLPAARGRVYVGLDSMRESATPVGLEVRGGCDAPDEKTRPVRGGTARVVRLHDDGAADQAAGDPRADSFAAPRGSLPEPAAVPARHAEPGPDSPAEP